MKSALPFSTLLLSYTCLQQAAARSEEQAILYDGWSTSNQRPKNVAIIGAGAAGSSAAYHLHKYAAEAEIPLNLTIIERNPYIGGRSTTVNAYDDPSQPIELGASIFVEVNQILAKAVKEFGLSTSGLPGVDASTPGAALGIWDGREFVLQLNEETGWWDYAKLFWRYGLAPLRTKNLMKSTVAKFLRMYEEPIFPFTSLTKAAQDVGLQAVTAATGEQYLRENKVGDMKFGSEVVQASTRVNYAQNLQYIHALEAMVCMAADGAMSVLGGNWQIFHQMVASTNSHVLVETEVTGIKARKKGGYTIAAQKSKSDNVASDAVELSSHFDDVILAAPHQHANLSLPDETDTTPDKIPYVNLHVTLLASPHLLNPKFFNLAKGNPVPHAILTTLPKDEDVKEGAAGVGSPGFFSISLLQAVTNPKTDKSEYLYKIFSAEPPDNKFLSKLLGFGLEEDNGDIPAKDVSWIYRKLWQSYPYEFPRVTFEDIQLHGWNADDGKTQGGLWYTSGIESFISTMETSALMGKNVARLIARQWEHGNVAKEDEWRWSEATQGVTV